jgi:hypothetical protein
MTINLKFPDETVKIELTDEEFLELNEWAKQKVKPLPPPKSYVKIYEAIRDATNRFRIKEMRKVILEADDDY